jgi:hypothetical protein
MSGFDYTDYDTSSYKDETTEIPESETTVQEYFPHKPGDYTARESWSSRKLERHIYENQTFTNKRLPTNRNALFKNCTFEDAFFVESDTSRTSNVNNVRFENCNFNGSIITDVPDDFRWMHNVLYFTGSATFDNTYMEEATILAPNFNVNVRGNANIDGTILSMYDPGPLGNVAAQYGTNVGFSDENNEAGIPEDVGTIHIHPNADGLLPIGIKSNIMLVPEQQSYAEY